MSTSGPALRPPGSALRERVALVPLRVRLVAAVLVLVAIGLLASGAAAASALRTYLLDRVDSQLVDASRDAGFLNAQLDPDGGGARPRERDPNDRYYLLVSLTDGSPYRVSTTTGDRPDLPPVTGAYATARGTQPFDVGSADGSGRWRVVLAPAVVDGGVPVVVALGAPLQEVRDTVRRLVLIELLVGSGVLVLLAVVAYGVVRGSLRPLTEVEETAAAIAGGDLARRVPRQDDRTEVGRLAAAFNSMLARIETSFRAQQASEAAARESEARVRQFVADASHELRTPLTSIRGFAELYRQGAVPAGPELDRVMGRVEGEAARMGQLVEEMLLLARLDQQRPMEQAPVDLLPLAADAVHDARAVDPERPVSLEVAGGPPVVLGDEARLRQVLVNLLANALTHTPAGTPVQVRVSTRGDRALVEVADAGPGLSGDQAARVFERFYRVDAARTRAAGGSGLGLSIVRAVVEAHGGRVGVRSTPGEGATFLVELPLAQQ